MNNYLAGYIDQVSKRSPSVWQRPLYPNLYFEIIQRSKTSDTTKMSLIIPNYNNSNYLESTLSSVIGQTIYPGGLEVIIIDDASTDKSLDIIKQFKSKNWTIVRILKNSGDHSLPSNLGIMLSKTPYTAYLDGDDTLHADDALKRGYSSIVHKLGMSISGVCIHLNSSSKEFSWVKTLEKIGDDVYLRHAKAYSPFELMEVCYAIGLRVFNKKTLYAVGGWEELLGPHCDFGLVLKIALHSSIVLNSSVCYDYYVHEGSMSHKIRNNALSLEKIRRDFVLKMIRESNIPFETLKQKCSALFWKKYKIRKGEVENDS